MVDSGLGGRVKGVGMGEWWRRYMSRDMVQGGERYIL